MSTSLIACTIDILECAVVRLKTSGDNGYQLSACKTLPFGLNDFTSRKGQKVLKKLDNLLDKWPGENLALSFGAKSYHPLPTHFPANAPPEECEQYCKIEAQYFLNQPEEYSCDFTGYGVYDGGPDEKKILLFYPAEPGKTASEHFAAKHRIVFRSSVQRPLLHLSGLSEERQIILELENNYLLLTVAKNGRIEKLFCQEIKNRNEMEYFTIRALVNNPVCKETEVQVTGTMADKMMTTLIRKETSITVKPLRIPESISVSNPEKLSVSSAAAVKAISTALMALSEV